MSLIISTRSTPSITCEKSSKLMGEVRFLALTEASMFSLCFAVFFLPFLCMLLQEALVG